ncbi:MAG: vanadium-dependent haloperoxidase [Xenococcaceae cyanobacterium MO_188.B32]|nr:vanadium-dependent haloperoxidase [Xenococcaceae cyanobacterium MO_188.B32]
MNNRRIRALITRINAAQTAFFRQHPPHIDNQEEFRYRDGDNRPTHIANFTKGLPHDVNTGIIVDPQDYQQFVRGVNSGDVRDFKATPLGPPEQDGVEFPEWRAQIAQESKKNGQDISVRAWESQGAGLTFDLEGPDAQAVTMPPAPTLDSQELVTEMIEIYSMALLRDVPFAEFETSPKVQTAIERLNNSPWIKSPNSLNLSPAEKKRLRKPFTPQTVFRGINKGDDVGSYLSQFLLVGNRGLGNIHNFEDGFIEYGSIRVNQRVRFAQPYKDYLTTWEAWIDAQNGADLRGLETYCDNPAYRFMATPRDLATYVHYDALYEAYLNACLTMLALGVKFDKGIPFQDKDFRDKQQGFAQFGGPHILSLVTEVATRALKAVRFQKFNVHRRLRPEVVGGWVNRFSNNDRQNLEVIQTLADGLGSELLNEVAAHNAQQKDKFSDDRGKDNDNGYENSFLLPMAFPEGSPMHPAYGAGHATVAGACVTILKAFFNTDVELPFCYEPKTDGSGLQKVFLAKPLTVEGELNKLAANISIGRNWAGVHYFTDYIESLRLGEQVAIAILQEQKLTYGEDFFMTLKLFDGGTIRI